MRQNSNFQQQQPTQSVTDLVAPEPTKRKVRSLSPKRKTSKKRHSVAPPMTQWIDSDESSQESKKSTSSRRRRSSKSKKMKRRCASPTNEPPSKLQALQEEVAKLKSIQDQMETYQVDLEKRHRDFQRQLHAMEVSHAMTETRNRELEFELEEVVEENERLSCSRRMSRSPQEESDSTMELLRFENQILRNKLERCQLALLRSTKRQSRQ
ncbi:MAG: hypothetical protein SGBAC_007489 [Bacillariaceae sp.]